MNRGNAYRAIQRTAEALSDFGRAIEIRERLLGEGRLLDENDLAVAYMNRGLAYSAIQKPAESLADYGRAIEIGERLLGESRLLDENHLAGAYMNRGIAYSDIHKTAEALADYGRAVEIRERLLGEGRLLDENDLASAYMNRGVAYLLAADKPIDAMDDLLRALELTNTLLSKRTYLIGQYMKTAYLALRPMIRSKQIENIQDTINQINDVLHAYELTDEGKCWLGEIQGMFKQDDQ